MYRWWQKNLNKSVLAWVFVLSENEIYSIMEEVSGEKLEKKYVRPDKSYYHTMLIDSLQIPAEEIEARVAQATELLAKEPTNMRYLQGVYSSQYNYSKYVRMDNRPEYARYLGYLDARELYPDFKLTSFREFVVDLLDGRLQGPIRGIDRAS